LSSVRLRWNGSGTRGAKRDEAPEPLDTDVGTALCQPAADHHDAALHPGLAFRYRQGLRGDAAVQRLDRDPNFKMSLSNEKTGVAGSGDRGYRRGTFKITYTNPQTKQAENSAGTYLTVFRKQADGSWKMVADFGV
jgi:hypothetical protein